LTCEASGSRRQQIASVAVEEELADRYRLLPGSAFDVDLGRDYDLVLLTNILHLFDPVACRQLVGKVHGALRRGGRAAILEFIPNEDRVSPTVPGLFALMMLATTPGGDTYTYSQNARVLRFAASELHPLPPTFFSVVIARK
jgi:hypothetical protein